MPNQKIEMEIDVPDGMEIKCQGTRNDLRPVITPTECTSQIVCNFILRRKDPVRESRWGWACCSFSSYEAARAAYPNIPLVRADHVDGKLVAVTLEPLGEGGGE